MRQAGSSFRGLTAPAGILWLEGIERFYAFPQPLAIDNIRDAGSQTAAETVKQGGDSGEIVGRGSNVQGGGVAGRLPRCGIALNAGTFFAAVAFFTSSSMPLAFIDFALDRAAASAGLYSSIIPVLTPLFIRTRIE